MKQSTVDKPILAWETDDLSVIAGTSWLRLAPLDPGGSLASWRGRDELAGLADALRLELDRPDEGQLLPHRSATLRLSTGSNALTLSNEVGDWHLDWTVARDLQAWLARNTGRERADGRIDDLGGHELRISGEHAEFTLARARSGAHESSRAVTFTLTNDVAEEFGHRLLQLSATPCGSFSLPLHGGGLLQLGQGNLSGLLHIKHHRVRLSRTSQIELARSISQSMAYASLLEDCTGSMA